LFIPSQNSMSTNRSLVNALFLIIQPLLLNAVSIPATAYIIRGMGPLGYGQWATALTVIGTLGFLSNLGLRPLFVRTVAQNPDDAPNALAHQLGIRFVLTCLSGLLACGFCLALRYDIPIIGATLILSLGLFATMVGIVLTDLLQGLHSIRSYVAVNLVSGVALTVATVVAVWLGAGPIGLSVAYLTGPILSAALLFIVVRRAGISVRLCFDFGQMRVLLRQAGGWTVSMAASAITNKLEQLMLPKLVGLAEMGYFSAGILLADRLYVIPDGLNGAFYPGMAKDAVEDKNRLANQIRKLMISSLSICLCCAIILSYYADPIARLLFPKSADFCRYVIQTTVWMLPLAGLMLPIGSSLLASGEQHAVAKANTLAAIVSIGLTIVLVSNFGLWGACWSYVLRVLLPLIFVIPCFAKRFPGLIPTVPWGRIALSAAVMACIFQAAFTLGDRSVAVYLAGGVAGLLAYPSMLVLLRVVSRNDVRNLMVRRSAAPTG
jgi:O-antigen/teichoic acid export membrane protein